jgi:ubiquinol-cytochrome c reductase cytochrome c1 subunit
LESDSELSSFRGNHEESSTGLRALALLGVGASGLLSFATIASADEAGHGLAAPNYQWPHAGIMSSYDHAS